MKFSIVEVVPTSDDNSFELSPTSQLSYGAKIPQMFSPFSLFVILRSPIPPRGSPILPLAGNHCSHPCLLVPWRTPVENSPYLGQLRSPVTFPRR